MKKYELLLALPGTLDEIEAQTRSNEILAFVKENSENAEISTMGKMRLAYPIKQIRYGYFYTIVFSTEVAKLKAMQEKFGLMRDLLRAMITEFNIAYNPSQRATFATTTSDASSTEETKVEYVKPEHTSAPVVKTEKAVEKVDMADIDKKLDEIISGNISGV